MKKSKSPFSLMIVLLSAIVLTSCCTEDPGSLQESEKQYGVTDFDRVDVGSPLRVTVRQGEVFTIRASGDIRNLNDLLVRKEGNTLLIDFEDNHNRKHETYITIIMPTLRSVNFSDASDSQVSGFYDNESLDVKVSGASVSHIDANADQIDIRVSGASQVTFNGDADKMDVEVAEASSLSAFNLLTDNAFVHASGASEARVTVSEELHAKASGASSIIYRGSPLVNSETSGASSVHKD